MLTDRRGFLGALRLTVSLQSGIAATRHRACLSWRLTLSRAPARSSSTIHANAPVSAAPTCSRALPVVSAPPVVYASLLSRFMPPHDFAALDVPVWKERAAPLLRFAQRALYAVSVFPLRAIGSLSMLQRLRWQFVQIRLNVRADPLRSWARGRSERLILCGPFLLAQPALQHVAAPAARRHLFRTRTACRRTASSGRAGHSLFFQL